MKIGGILSYLFRLIWCSYLYEVGTVAVVWFIYISVSSYIVKIKSACTFKNCERFGDENIFGVVCGGFLLWGVLGERKPLSSSDKLFLFTRLIFIFS
jgi:hypothetical protein